jgi:hypothetical protein
LKVKDSAEKRNQAEKIDQRKNTMIVNPLRCSSLYRILVLFVLVRQLKIARSLSIFSEHENSINNQRKDWKNEWEIDVQ